MATCAEITGAQLKPDQGEESVSLLPLLQGEDNPVRNFAIHHSMSGRFAIRQGDWVFIASPTGDDNNEPEWFKEERGYTEHGFPGELFNLKEDIGERINHYAEQPAMVEELSALLARAKGGGVFSGISSLDDEFLTE